MNRPTNSLNAFSKPTKPFERHLGDAREATSPPVGCKVYSIEAYIQPIVDVPVKHTAIGSLAARWDKSVERQQDMQDARRWLADTFHANEGDTIRTLRLRKGWSQARLAEEIGTSQSHIARIERGTENLAIETCRRLTGALDVDMNTLNDALRRQEVVAQSRAAQ